MGGGVWGERGGGGGGVVCSVWNFPDIKAFTEMNNIKKARFNVTGR